MLVKLHLVGAKAARQMAAHAALVQAAIAAGKPAPKPPALNFDNFSGRGVRLRTLDLDEKDKIAEIVSKNVGEGGLITEYNRLRERGCVHKCIAAVTKEKELDEAGLANATWVKVTEEDLEEPRGERSAKVLFTTKDMTTLVAWYREQHEVSMDDLAAIMGKAHELEEDVAAPAGSVKHT